MSCESERSITKLSMLKISLDQPPKRKDNYLSMSAIEGSIKKSIRDEAIHDYAAKNSFKLMILSF